MFVLQAKKPPSLDKLSFQSYTGIELVLNPLQGTAANHKSCHSIVIQSLVGELLVAQRRPTIRDQRSGRGLTGFCHSLL